MSRRFETIAALQIAGAVWLDIYKWETIPSLTPLRWPFSAIVWLTPFAWLLRSPDVFGAVRRLPLATLALWGTWYLIAVNWSNAIPSSAAYALGVVSTILAAAWFAGAFGWERLAQVVAVTIAVFALGGLFYRGATGQFLADSHRFVGIGNNPTDTGRHVATMALCGLAGFRGRRGWQAGIFALGVLIAGVAVAKTAMVGLAICLVYLAYRTTGRVGRLRILVMIAALAAVAGTFIAILSGERSDAAAGPLSTRSTLTVTGRTDVWRTTAELAGHHLMAGSGTGSSTLIYAEVIADGWLQWEVTTAHNLWLQTLLEHGIIGLGLAVATAGSLAARCRRAPHHLRDAVLIWLLLNSATEALIQYPGLPLVIIAAAAGMFTSPRPQDISVVYDDPTQSRPMLVSVSNR